MMRRSSPSPGSSIRNFSMSIRSPPRDRQGGPLAVEQSVYQVVGGAYRKANITTLELRYNPMKRNRGGERDLDHIIMASIRGLDRALLEYPVKAGLIFCLDRTFDQTLNSIILEKAMAYRHRGVIAGRITSRNGCSRDRSCRYRRRPSGIPADLKVTLKYLEVLNFPAALACRWPLGDAFRAGSDSCPEIGPRASR